MPNVTINGETFTAQTGERLVDPGRRNGAHIGFFCDGRGICQTCACRVVKGNDQLSEPNEVERIWLSQAQLDAGERLACQTQITGAGAIEIETRAEDMRNQLSAALRGDLSGVRVDVATLGSMALGFPVNLARTLPHAASRLPNLEGINAYFSDVFRVLGRMTAGGAKRDGEDKA